MGINAGKIEKYIINIKVLYSGVCWPLEKPDFAIDD